MIDIKTFYDWLLKRDKDKAEQLKIICNLGKIPMGLRLPKFLRSLIENELSIFRKELIEFCLERKTFVYCQATNDLKYLYNKGYITKDQFKEHCLTVADSPSSTIAVYYLYSCSIFSLEDIIDILMRFAEKSTNSSQTAFEVNYLLSHMQSNGVLSNEEADDLRRKISAILDYDLMQCD